MTESPLAYSIYNDSIILSLLILSILSCCHTLATNGYSIAERIKNIYFDTGHSNPYNSRSEISLSGNITLYILVIFSSTVIALDSMQNVTDITDRNNAYITIAILGIAFAIFLLLKRIIYDIVNLTLFGREQAKQWKESYFFTIKIMGILLLPLSALLIIYPSISDIITVIYLSFAIILYQIMLIIRCFNIIFTEKCYFLDIFLYLCAIELLPLGLVWYAISKTNLLEIIKI